MLIVLKQDASNPKHIGSQEPHQGQKHVDPTKTQVEQNLVLFLIRRSIYGESIIYKLNILMLRVSTLQT